MHLLMRTIARVPPTHASAGCAGRVGLWDCHRRDHKEEAAAGAPEAASVPLASCLAEDFGTHYTGESC